MVAKKILALLVMVMFLGKVHAQSIERSVESNEEIKKPKMKKYNRLVYAAPIQFTENGFGFAFGYEQIIDKDGIVAYTLPFVGTYNTPRSDYYGPRYTDAMYYFMPGLKFYPTGSRSKINYGIGPSIVAGLGKTSVFPDYYVRQQQDKFLLGVMLNNSMNINVTKSIYMGMEFGVGFTYIRQYDGVKQGMGGLAQGGFKVGYKF